MPNNKRIPCTIKYMPKNIVRSVTIVLFPKISTPTTLIVIMYFDITSLEMLSYAFVVEIYTF